MTHESSKKRLIDRVRELPPMPGAILITSHDPLAQEWLEVLEPRLQLALEIIDTFAEADDGDTFKAATDAWYALRRECAWLVDQAEEPAVETSRDAGLINEIFERHDRCSKLLWGPASLPGMMLGPMDADAAHRDRGTLLSLLPPQVKTSAVPGAFSS